MPDNPWAKLAAPTLAFSEVRADLQHHYSALTLIEKAEIWALCKAYISGLLGYNDTSSAWLVDEVHYALFSLAPEEGEKCAREIMRIIRQLDPLARVEGLRAFECNWG